MDLGAILHEHNPRSIGVLQLMNCQLKDPLIVAADLKQQIDAIAREAQQNVAAQRRLLEMREAIAHTGHWVRFKRYAQTKRTCCADNLQHNTPSVSQ